MRIWIGVIAVAAGCSSAVPEGSSASSVRDRLARVTPLFVTGSASSGMITASRNTATGWQDGATPLAVMDGELDASADASGALEVSAFELELAPIDLPSDVLGQPAQLTSVKLALGAAAAMPAMWNDANHASAIATVDLNLDWTLVVGGSAAPLGTQQLQGVMIDVQLAGDGEPVMATIAVTGDGELWSWADLVRLEGLQLQLQALSNP